LAGGAAGTGRRLLPASLPGAGRGAGTASPGIVPPGGAAGAGMGRPHGVGSAGPRPARRSRPGGAGGRRPRLGGVAGPAPPGPFAWREEASAVVDCLGARQVYSIDRDLYVPAALAAPQRPVRIQVPGPVRLRLEVRPLHPRGSTAPLDDWISIREPGLLRWV